MSDSNFLHRLDGGTGNVRIAVVGCGGAGCNAIGSLGINAGGVARTIAVNTDAAHLLTVQAGKKLLIGRNITAGRGAGGNAEIGRSAAEEARKTVREELSGTDMVFVIAGMGGGTGSGASSVIASAAREAGAMPISIVTMPFSFERGRRERAKDYLRELVHVSESTVILENQKIIELYPEQNVYSAFGLMNTLISDLVLNLSSTLVKPSLINVSYGDFRSVMRTGKTSTLIFNENSDIDVLVRGAVTKPFFQNTIKAAKGALIHVSGGSAMTLGRMHRIIAEAQEALGGCSNVILGARDDGRKNDILSLTAVVTGLEQAIS